MPPIIERGLSQGCGTCEDSCPLDVIHMDEGEAVPIIKYPKEYWHRGSYRQDCPEGAITILFPLRMMVSAGISPY